MRRTLSTAVRTAAVLTALLLGLTVSAEPAQSADPCSPPVQNWITCENSKQGSPPSEWDVDGAGDATIQGFATDISVNRGQTVSFKIKSNATAYRIDIYRLGYYGGNGARKVATITPSATLPQSQPACAADQATGLVDCGNWAVSASWSVPDDAVSGIYIARPVRLDTDGASHIPFVVRDDGGHEDVLFQTSDQTWQAYNSYGGSSLYLGTAPSVGNPQGRAYKVSYNRPFNTRAGEPTSWLLGPEFSMVQWLERNGYDLAYFTGVDASRRGTEIPNHKMYLSAGHDEYWSGQQRGNVEAARDAGVNLAFFSGNEVFWKTRWESSIDGASTAWRTLVCYKESAAGRKLDPSPVWTGLWRDARFSPPADGGRPENQLTGQLFEVQFRSDPITVPAADGKMRFWRNTSIANLTSGQSAALPSGLLGYEWDVTPDNGFRPAGQFYLSTSTYPAEDYDTGEVTPHTHHLSLYRAGSGALVFGSGTIQWSLGLASGVYNEPPGPDSRVQQATVNLLADMGAQPASLQQGLVPASRSTDTTAPTTAITSPTQGANLERGSPVTIQGSATDSGGVVAAIEVSLDGGATWHPAIGRSAWSYTGVLGGFGSVTLKARAVDDSGNIEPTPAAVTVATGSCPCSLWNSSTTPATAAVGDGNAYELGVKLQSDTSGYISGVRFYKGALNTGTHLAHLWTAGGTLLASATFANETASGWQQVNFASPIAVNANTTYVASYTAPNGHFALDRPYFSSAYDNAPLHALADGVSGGNGVYGAPGNFPTQTSSASNYWVDISFDLQSADTTPPIVSTVSPQPGAAKVSTTTGVNAAFNEAVDASTITSSTFQLKDAGNTVVAASVGYNGAGVTATLVPSAPLAEGAAYTATVRGGSSGVKDVAGNALAADYSWSFTTATPGVCPCSLWNSTQLPGAADSGDGNAYELGVKLQSDTSGYISGVRFYKGALNTGTHLAHLWTAGGTLLASATFANETASGWQQVNFASPIAVNANTTYVASYTAPNGHFALDRPYFSSAYDNAPLHALADGVSGGNGVYAIGSSFPAASFGASNYWVDVVFSQTVTDTSPPNSTTAFPAANGAYNATGWAAGCPAVGLCGAATDAMSSLQKVEVSIRHETTGSYWDGTTFSSPVEVFLTTTGTTSWSYPIVASKLSTNSQYRVRVRASDAAGNVEAPRSSTFVYDTQAPTASAIFPATGVSYNTAGWNAGCPTSGFCGTASDSGAGVQRVEISLRQGSGNYWDGTAFTSSTQVFVPVAGSTSWSYAFPATSFPANAQYTLRVRAIDGAGNVQTPVALTFRYDTTNPSSSFTFPASNGIYNAVRWDAGCTPSGVCGTASDVSGVKKVEVSLRQGTGNYWNGSAFASATEVFVTATGTTSWNYAAPATLLPADGSYTVRVRSTDNAGNVQNPTSRTFTYDTIPPRVTSVTPAAGASGVKVTTTVTAVFSEPVSASTVSTTTFRLADAVGNVIPANVTYNNGKRTATLTPLSALTAGTAYTATVKGGGAGVTDVAGNPLASDFTWSFRT